ncbi:MAG: ATP-dependent helicase/nuclease subunit A [Melioribacteraceae bacterium]|nr:MAG: ATP-dependent helicase/nuclease subunit A [Melioribacteraceae bacterium]
MAKLTPYQEQALRSDIHISLTANAGSGKTFVLSKRYVDIALNRVKSLGDMVAITFTEKAAGELQKKIAKEIDERLENSDDPNEAKKLINLRRQLVSANISTIHSFCINILKEFSPEAGIDANFIPVDPEAADELIELSLEEVYLKLLENDNDATKLKSVVRILGSKSLLFNELRSALSSRKKYIDLKRGLYSEKENVITENFRTVFDRYFAEIFSKRIEELISVVKSVNDQVLEVDENNETVLFVIETIPALKSQKNSIDQARLALNLCDGITTSSGSLKKRGYTSKVKGNDFEYESDLISQIYAELNLIEIPENIEASELQLARFGKNFLFVFDKVLEEYTDKKYRSGYLDFEDILLYTKDLLENRNVQEGLAKKFRYIMIDEYQDTNEIQYEIFMPILDGLRKNNLFVVGDEKQSIYRFRDAELAVFRRTREDIKSAKNEEGILNLPHSFRVSPPIALLVNKIFRKLFDNPQPLFNEVEHSDLLCARDKDDEGSITIILNNEKEEESKSESELAAGEILELVGSGKKDFGDIAVLSKRRIHFQRLESVFLKYKIPYTIMGGRGFYQNQVVFDIHNYLAFALNENNDAALVGILRSPFYLLSDTALYEISLCDGFSFFEKSKNHFGSESEIIKKLETHVKFAKRVNPQKLLLRILEDTGYWATAAANDPSGLAVANIEKLVTIAGSYFSQGMKTLYDFVFYLEEAIDSMPDEAQAEVVKDDNSVKIMTVHQSKGLEFDTVILFGANDRIRNDNVKSRSVSVDGEFGVLTKVPPDGDYFRDYVSPPVNGIYNYINYRKGAAEIKRLFYVAVTRAVNNLIVTATHKDFAVSKDSFLEYFISSLNIDAASPEFYISGNLEFMNGAENNFERFTEKVSTRIEMKQNPEYQYRPVEIERKEKPDKILMMDEVEDTQSGEIISATKIAIFKQCPVKYRLTYELGYSGLLGALEESNFPRLPEPDNEEKSEETTSRADLVGSLCHKLLELEVGRDKLEETLGKEVERIAYQNSLTIGERNNLENETSGILSSFFDTGLYEELGKSKNYKNEFEIYVKQEDFYLYGIIDKFVENKDRYLVADYKTDEVSEKNASEKLKRYLSQLKFYALLVNKYLGEKETEVKLVFLKRPDLSASITLGIDEIKKFEKEVEDIIYSIREGNYSKNTEHCFACYFSEKGKCPIK